MARYDYRCTVCGNTFEVDHPMSEHPRVTCPSCGASAERVFAASAIAFKGSGFYNTDQRDKGAHSCSGSCTHDCASCS
ncbi:MAG: FmdB family transcriptional regulator [Atopobiaceae bacterium]|jgi:putative FmdB family regulatory protein|nr:FmdB family transcriptional regulator [Atopobiaceae bacterium]MCI2173337.1 FmdB family transcriptional regulator [Atopobiaceae bacterium]MCI2207332.1 FmdB family transcriptional regulator [Atopobiaceae bacterium]